MPNFRYALRLTAAFFSKFWLIVLLSLILGIAFFLLLTRFGPDLLSRKSERIGIVGRYSPDNLPDTILNDVSEGLTRLEPDGTVKPGIASSWEAQDNGKTWIFHLDQNKTWQDGKKIVSQNLQFSFSDVTVTRPDPKTLIFKVQSPFAPFPVIVSQPLFKKGYLGDGAWQIKKFTISGNNAEKIIMTDKNKNRKTYYFYPNEDRAKLALKLGMITSLVDIFNPDPFTNWKTVKTAKQVDYGKYATVFFNAQKGSVTEDKTLRQALAYAINKSDFGEVRAISPISPNSWAYNPQVKPYDFDPARAKELINGLSKEEKGVTLKLFATPILMEAAEKIAKDWENAGMAVSVQVTSGIPDQFDAFLAIFDIPTDPDQYALWHSNQDATNIANYSNARIDKLLEDGRTQLDQATRKRIYLDFQRFLVEDAPAVFLYYPTLYTVTRI